MDRSSIPKQAMILAAGKGNRLGALTLRTPKPLIKIDQLRLIEYHLHALAVAGYLRVVINVAYMKQKIIDTLGDGSRYGIHIIYSIEPDKCLGTGGGIAHALHHFNDQPFLLVSADIWSDFDYSNIQAPRHTLAHCVVIDNPEEHPQGDMTLNSDGKLSINNPNPHTYAGIAILHPKLFYHRNQKTFSLAQPLLGAINNNKVTGQIHHGPWFNVGTASQIRKLKRYIHHSHKQKK